MYLGNKKLIFLACNTEQVHAAILESSKINDLFQNRQIYSCRIFETFRNFLDMVSLRAHLRETREVQVQSEGKDKDGRHLLAT